MDLGTTRSPALLPPAPRPLARLALLAAWGLAAAVSLGGCAEDERVCDATGCYWCDGLGCRPAGPEDEPPCQTQDDCPDGTLCTTEGCVAVCADDDDCPPGQVCADAGDGRRLCVDDGQTPPVCVDNDDCLASGVECRDGLCVPSNVCDEDGDCDAAEACVDGRCLPRDDRCRFSRECEAPRACVDGRCVLPCTGDGDCVAGEVCDTATGFCEPAPPPPPGCERDADCGAGEVCTDGACVDGCRTDVDCGEGRRCEPTGVCVPDTRREVFCESNADCSAGSRCVDGNCRRPCDDDLACRRFDAQLPFCVEGFCATSNEATSDCALSSDCPAGETCIDGVCRR